MSTSSGEALHTTVGRWAVARPEATAVVHGSRRTSYAELDRTADAWAAGLASRGVGRGDLVPVLLPRGTELVAAVLAVLKCGAAYALLDPAWPARRIQEVTGQLSARLIVTDAPEAARHAGLPAWSPAVCGDTGEPAGFPAGTAAPTGFRPAEVGADAPACVFFTSGTTGRPKGVLTPHRATARLVRAGTFARFTPSTVIPLAAALPWDAFSLELWGALLGGGTCVVVDEPYLSAQALREAVAVHGADTVWLTSSLLNMIVDEDPDAFRGLRQVMTGGERLSVPHVRAFLRRHPGIALVNGYGPVESTVFATTHRVTESDCDLPGGIPVGRPVPGTAVHLVDGEICVAGDGLALRYLGEPALTEAAFPRITVDGRQVRVYRTGDLGELDEDGVLHYRGRADRQVKIRGHRIEPAEVERQVEALLPSVRACRVVATRDTGGNANGLLAFCVPAERGELPPGAEEQVRTELVHYQRPDAVVAVPAFPVTPNGKLDERALLELAPSAVPTAAAAPEAPRAPARETDEPLVELAAAVFAAVLGVASVPEGTAFADLGGTSLGAGRVCARLAAELERPVPLSRLYEHPTARALGRWLALTGGTPRADAEAGDDVPLSPMQAGYLTNHLLRPEDRSAHCLLLFRIDGELDLDALDAAVEAVHERHEVLRTAYCATPRLLARPAELPAPVLEIMDTAPDADAATEELSESLGAPLELADGEVWRTALVPLGSGRSWIFGCVVHHIAFDGWSESVLAAHLAEAYNAAAGGTPPAAPLTAPTAAEAARLRRDRLAHADLARQRAELEAELTGVPELVWPAAPSPADAAGRSPQRIEHVLDADAAARVDAAAAGAGTTRYAVLLACYGQVLAEVTGGRDFAVGTPVAQRSDSRLDEAVGCHIEMACLRLRGDVLDGGPGSFAAAARIADRAFRSQDVAFHDLVRLLNPPRTGRPPVFQTLLVLQDNAPPQLPLTGLTTTHLRPPYLDIPLEVQTEFWPLPGGRLRLTVNYRPDTVRSTTAHELTKRLADLVHTLPLPEGDPS